MQDTIDQRLAIFPSQKNQRKKGSGSPDESTNTRKVKLQTSFPPIHLSLISNCKSQDKKHKDHVSNLDVSKDVRGEKINLPQVEKASDKIPKPAKPFPEKSKHTKDYGCNMRPRSNTPTLMCDGEKDTRLDKQLWLDVPFAKTMAERVSPEIAKVPECPSCKNERRIRNDYDKILLQSKRENEFLQEKIRELEAKLKRHERVSEFPTDTDADVMVNLEHESDIDSYTESKKNEKKNKFTSVIELEDYRKLEASNKAKQEQIDRLLIEIEELKNQLNKVRNSEREQGHLFENKQSKLVGDIEDLKLQLDRAKVHENLKVSNLESEKENILKQLENTKAELEKFKKRKSFLVSELRKEKECCVLEIEKLKAFTDKVTAENTSLSDTIKLQQEDLEKRALCSCFTPQVYSADYNYQEFCSCGRKLQNLSQSSNKGPVTQVEEDVRVKELYKQLKRERNLLLDVMAILYTRRWFVEEAVPHVKRALRKCGVFSEDSD